MSSSLWPHGLQHTRLPCPSVSPRVCSNSCPLSQWCHPTVSSCRPLLLLPSIFQHQDLFQWVHSSHQVARVLELQLQHPSFYEYWGWISFRMNWFDLLAIQGTLKSSPASQFKRINSSVLSLLYGPTLTSVHVAAAAAAKLLQLCPTLRNPKDYSLPGSSIHGIF